MSKSLLPGILAMATTVVASNILVQYLLGPWLTWGAISYPIAFLINDLTNRLQGAAAARRVVIAGFIVGVVCSLIGSQIEGEFGPLVSQRVAVASGLAFLVSQLTDIAIFNRLRRQGWWRAPLFSPMVSSVLDTSIFFTIAFAGFLTWLEPANDVSWAGEMLPLLGLGPVVPLWVSLAAADLLVKFGIAIVALVPFRVIVGKLTQQTA